MKHLLIQFLLTVLSVNLVIGQDAKVKLHKITVNTVANNPFFDDWSGEIFSPGDTVSIKSPVKKDLPENMRMSAVIQFDGNQVADVDTTVCEAFDDETLGKDILAKGIPDGEFPKSCPVKPGSNFEISKYIITKDKIPEGAPDGKIIADVTIYEPEKDPYVTIHVEGELTHM
ncbi:uncharacterized protein LOC130673161 [Microplitis mediator]|uniref:uncharacterized protein LOC130673161 n=1 Tax=Microplitis mediator TaxID=375433 RepID=UPI002555A262|nr:uncharacterized protein LOC130673161 [Microplitis mediator]